MNFLKNEPKKVYAILLIWSLMHLCFLVFPYHYYERTAFWPFGNTSLHVYDFSEFFFYSLAPTIVYSAFLLWKKSSSASAMK